MSFSLRKVNALIHHWLGLATGAVMFIVCFTGAIWVFNSEISALLNPGYNNIDYEAKPVLLPSVVKKTAERLHPGMRINYAEYAQGRAITVGVGMRSTGTFTLRIHPYNGKVLDDTAHPKDQFRFFNFILDGHRSLWLPPKIGRPIVNYSVIIFIVLLVTGVVRWYLEKWKALKAKRSLSINMGADSGKLTIDLHNVLGLYAMIVLLVISLTGLIWGLGWFSNGVYWITSGGKALPGYVETLSDSTNAGKYFKPDQALDSAFLIATGRHPDAKGFYYGYIDTTNVHSTIFISIYPSAGHFYDSRTYNFDRHTLRIFEIDGVYDGDFASASTAIKLKRMNYDLHVGNAFGLPGKILVFVASLIGASLPVTGFLIWRNRRTRNV